uniref:Tectonic domain-containing protein n=1 Tax=Romanomermis culicivorax TaxID=13658 RepID=A0A915JGS6_ROMCU
MLTLFYSIFFNTFAGCTTLGNDICACDLVVKVCEIGCCCDADCSEVDKISFQCDVNNTTKSGRCFDQTKLAFNNLNVALGVKSGGLLCIYYDNSDGFTVLSEPRLLETEGDIAKISKYLNQDLYIDSNTADSLLKNYSYGSSIYTIYGDGRVTNMLLPAPGLMSTDCNYEMENSMENAYALIAKQKNAIASNESSGMATDFSADSLPEMVNIQLVDDDKSLLLKASLEQVDLANGPTLSIAAYSNWTRDQKLCGNVPVQVSYTIMINETLDIIAVYAKIILSDISSLEPYFLRRFSAKFVLLNTTIPKNLNDSVAYPKSGNPGYVEGLPVVAGHRDNINDSVVIDRQNFFLAMLTMRSGDGLCDTRARDPILFGYEKQTFCFIEISRNLTSEDCRLLKNRILTSFISTDKNFIGAYGNSKPSNLEEWIPILKENEPKADEENLLQCYCTKLLVINVIFTED